MTSSRHNELFSVPAPFRAVDARGAVGQNDQPTVGYGEFVVSAAESFELRTETEWLVVNQTRFVPEQVVVLRPNAFGKNRIFEMVAKCVEDFGAAFFCFSE